MFKLIFKGIVVFFFIVFLTVSLALWKGGEPFKWLGDGLIIMGKEISRFGDHVDEFMESSKKFQKNYDKIRNVLDTDDDEK